MFQHIKIKELDDFFIELNKRDSRGIYFYRINGYNQQIFEFIKKYYEAARTTGVIIEGRIPNPDEKNLSYYNEMMGMNFQLSMGFITSSLMKWLPRMNDYQRNAVASSIYDTLESLRKKGKNDNMLKNAYIKFMCWLYYKFERIVSRLGDNTVPKILYEGDISNYELLLVEVLANAGCDVVFLQYHGDAGYSKLDPASEISDNLSMPGMKDFPVEFNLKWLRQEIQNSLNTERLYGIKPTVFNCTNAWIQGKGLEDIKTAAGARGNDPGLFYNCFIRINGVEDKLTYLNDLYQFQLEIKNAGRKLVIVDNEIPQPSMEEIGAIKRKNYTTKEQMIMDLSSNFHHISDMELQRLQVKSFVDVMLEESEHPGMTVNKLTNKAVYILCWIKRYYGSLFANWRLPEVGLFILMGGCRNENESLFLKFLSRLPADILILNPDLNRKCCLEDKMLYEINYTDSLVVEKYPQENTQLHIGTAAYHAERELDTIMYQNSGMYRNQQYGKAVSVTLQTMYEEISILWSQELKYRPNFSIVNDVVNIPVIFAKVSGVKDNNIQQYFSGIKGLITADTFVIKDVPFINSTDPNPVKAYVTEFFKNGKLKRNSIKSHQSYRYGVLREEIQDHILDKLELLIEQKIIKGTFENGTEYTVIATVLNMGKEIIRMLQKFDFTKVNPKIIYINTTEKTISLEDSILTAFLNLVGFDIVFFVPTGYQSIEKYFNRRLMEEHQIGEYVYDLQVPNFSAVSSNTRPKWRDKIFKRGT